MGQRILIVTLGSKPQLATLALDCLHGMGEDPDALLVVHASRDRPETQKAIDRIETEIAHSYSAIQFRCLELQENGSPLPDITSPGEVQAAFQALFAALRTAKLDDQKVHMLIAGGRRTLTVAGMATAQMLFDDDDRLWHITSHPDLELSGELHASPGHWCRLIPIPVITWGRLSPVFDVLKAVDDPFMAAQKLSELRLRDQWDQARIFVLTQLSAAERNVVELLVRDGLNQNEIADALSLSPRTVEQHLRSAYMKAEAHWELESDVHQAQLVRLLSIFFTNEVHF